MEENHEKPQKTKDKIMKKVDEVIKRIKETDKNRKLMIGIVFMVLLIVFGGLSYNKTTTTVCAPKEQSSLTLKVTMESKDGVVINFSQQETTDLEKYNMTEKEFKTAAKEIKKGVKTYDGLSYEYEVKDGVGIERLILDTEKATPETYNLLGLSTKLGEDGKTERVTTEKAIESMTNYSLECK